MQPIKEREQISPVQASIRARWSSTTVGLEQGEGPRLANRLRAIARS